jgi:hypothetical protein
MCDPGGVPDDPQQELPSPATRKDHPHGRPFPRSTYVYGWLVICIVLAEGIHSLVSGKYGTGIILIGLVPLMAWLMHTRRQQEAADRRRR